MNIYIIEL